MHKIHDLRILAWLLAVLCLISSVWGKPKNVLFIAVDDLRPELGCYGSTVVQSPCIDSLAASGVVFDRAYCQQAVCAPSRASLMSGLRPDSTTIYDLDHPLRETRPHVRTLPQHFREAGYETVSLGKIYHHRKDDNPLGWTGLAWHPRGGDWKGRGYLTPAAQDQIDTGSRKGVGVGPALEAAEVADEAYPDGKTLRKAVEELQRLKRGATPFFLAVGFSKPHLPFNAPKRYWDLYARERIPLSTQVRWPQAMPSFAGMGWGELKGYTDIPNNATHLDEAMTRKLKHGYLACVSYTDALIGQVLSELNRLELRDQTVIVLWGDHGWKLGDYGAWCKHTNFEIDTQVPLIFSAPGITGKQRVTSPVEMVDIYPTLCELAGLSIPTHCEGASLLPQLRDPRHPGKPAAFSQYPRGKRMGYSLRSGDWRYTEWIDRSNGEILERELYHHTQGPLAVRNLVNDPLYAETAGGLSGLLNQGQGWRAFQVAGRLKVPQD